MEFADLPNQEEITSMSLFRISPAYDGGWLVDIRVSTKDTPTSDHPTDADIAKEDENTPASAPYDGYLTFWVKTQHDNGFGFYTPTNDIKEADVFEKKEHAQGCVEILEENPKVLFPR